MFLSLTFCCGARGSDGNPGEYIEKTKGMEKKEEEEEVDRDGGVRQLRLIFAISQWKKKEERERQRRISCIQASLGEEKKESIPI